MDNLFTQLFITAGAAHKRVVLNVLLTGAGGTSSLAGSPPTPSLRTWIQNKSTLQSTVNICYFSSLNKCIMCLDGQNRIGIYSGILSSGKKRHDYHVVTNTITSHLSVLVRNINTTFYEIPPSSDLMVISVFRVLY